MATIDLYDLLANIQKRPAMYLGSSSILGLRTFLAGYGFGRRQAGIAETVEEQEFAKFPSWIQLRFGITSHQTWDRIILFFSQSDEAALGTFFQLLAEFRQEQQAAKNTDAQPHLDRASA